MVTIPNTKQINSKTTLLSSLSKLQEEADKGKWKLYYDSEMDDFFYGPMPVPKDARLISADNEISYYVTPESRVVGVFIQYWKTNFLQHHQNLKSMEDLFRKDTGTIKKSAEKKGDVDKYKRAFIEQILKRTLKS